MINCTFFEFLIKFWSTGSVQQHFSRRSGIATSYVFFAAIVLNVISVPYDVAAVSSLYYVFCYEVNT